MKLLSIDLDGTFFGSDSQPTAENIKTIQQLLQQGIHVVFNTGRPMDELRTYPSLIALQTPLICYNGSQIYNANHELIEEYTFPLQDAKNAILSTKSLDFGVRLQTDKGEFQGEEAILALSDAKVYKLIFSTKREKESLYAVKEMMDPAKFHFFCRRT